MKRKLKEERKAVEEDESEGSEPETESDDGENMDTASSGEPQEKVAKTTKADLYKPPTNEELHSLKETENLFHSTLFRMQITELLNEAKLKAKRRTQIEAAIETVKKIIHCIPIGQKLEMSDEEWLSGSGVQVPMMSLRQPWKGSFQYHPPTEMHVTGSLLSDTCVRPSISADLVVCMPKECFDRKDFLNHRYMRKRALYVSTIAMAIAMAMKERSEIEGCAFTYHHGNHLKPVLVAMVSGCQKPIQVNIHVVADSDVFKLNRFHVSKNNVRAGWFYGTGSAGDQQEDQAAEAPTPFYNSSILEDITHKSCITCLERLSRSSPAVKEGIVLLKVWLRQRHLDYGYGGFNGFVSCMLVVHLLSQRKLNPQMSSYQIFRNTLLRLAQSDWTTEGISMCRGTSDDQVPSLAEFHTHSDVVFVDQTGYLNMCHAMNKSTFHRIKHEAKLALSMLEDKSLDSFDKLFIRRLPVNLTFDHLMHVNLSAVNEKCAERLGAKNQYVDHGGEPVSCCLRPLVDRLSVGLGRRVTLLQLQQRKPPSWSVTDSAPVQKAGDYLTFGLLLEPSTAFSVLERGPAADSPMAEEFRRFWGSRSELRRFQDGGICEAVLWMETGTSNMKQLVCGEVAKAVLDRHAGIQETEVHYMAGQLDPLLSLPVTTRETDNLSYGTGEEQNQEVITSYDQLCKLLRSLDDLPLNITSIQGVSPCFRFAEVFPPQPCTFKHHERRGQTGGVKRYIPATDRPAPVYTPTLKVVCMMEGSGKWPEDVEAMRRLKAAFHIKMAKLLQSKYGLAVRVSPQYVDILKDHFVFRVCLASLQEIALLKMVKSPDGLLQKRETEEAQLLQRDIVALPRLTSTLHGLRQQHNSYGSSVRLARRWVCAHMLGDYIHPVAVEMMVAYLYLSPAPHTPPRSGIVGFQRFLELLSTFDWKLTPLLVNLNNEYTDQDLVDIPSRFRKERATLPLMFISTPLDKYSSHWTRRSPIPAILQRLVLLAHKSLTVMSGLITSWDPGADYKQVFRPALDMYDVLIHLELSQLPRQLESVDHMEGVYVPRYGKTVDEDRFPVTDFDPVELYLQDLRASFEELCLLFHDQHGGSVIGVLWKPQALQQTDFKVSHINYSQPSALESSTKTDLRLEPNLDAVLEDFQILGRGLVKKIEVRNKNT